MQFEYPYSEVICFDCIHFEKGIGMGGKIVSKPNCKFLNYDFGASLKFRNKCLGFSASCSYDVPLPEIRKIRD